MRGKPKGMTRRGLNTIVASIITALVSIPCQPRTITVCEQILVETPDLYQYN